MRMRSTAVVLLTVSLVFSSMADAKPRDKSKVRWNAAQVIVKYKSGRAPELGKHGVKKARKVFGQFKLKGRALQHATARGLDRVYVLDLDQDEVEKTVAILSKDPNVEYAEPNWRIELAAVPNDPSYTAQWGLAKVGAPAAWDVATAGTGVVVGVVDTGIDLTHPDLVANLWTNPGEIAGNGIDDDDNGFVDDVHGWDFAAGDNDPTDTSGHGTRVAGIIGAAGNNATGVSGVAWGAKLAALRMGGVFASVDAAAQAVGYANMMGFRITSNSWGWNEGGQTFLLDDVVNAAEAAGHLFIVAAGNDFKDNDQFPTYPAHYDKPNVISVTGSTQTDALYGNYGASSVDLAAPAVSIDSTAVGGTYASGTGTSFATPFVAGAAALYWTANPAATAAEVREQLLLTTDVSAAFHGKTVSGGRLSLANLFDPETVAPAAIGDLTVIDATYRSVTLRLTSTGDDGAAGTASRYDVRIATSALSEANFANATQLAGEPMPLIVGTLQSFKLSGLAPSTTYYVAVRAYDNAGNGSALSNVATFTTTRVAVLFDDNVEGGARAWTVEGSDGAGGPALWHVRAQYNESKLWSYSNASGYDTGARNWGALTSPELNLAQARDARLRLRQHVWTERQFDAEIAQVQISMDGGPWTTVLAKLSTDYLYVHETIDLSAYDGHRIRVRFFFDTIDEVRNDLPGWQVDDVVLEATSTNAPPVANGNGPYGVIEDAPATLSSSGSIDPEGASLEYKWNFGDGSFAYTTSASVTHTWTRPGTYTVTLTAFDGSNSSDPVTTVISPAPVNDRPVAGLVVFGTPPFPEETQQTIAPYDSSDEEGAPLHCRYDWGDGTTEQRPCGWFAHTWNRPGTYTVTLIVNDGQLDSLPDTETITILEASNDKPIARAGGPYASQPSQPVTLDGTASTDEETSIASWLWTFPDGTTSTQAQPSKSFPSGVHAPTLVVTDQTGVASNPVAAQVRVCGGANIELFGQSLFTCPGGTARVGINVRSGILPLNVTWADGFTQQVTSLSNGYYAERVVTPSQPATYALSSVTDFMNCGGTVGPTTQLVQFASATLSDNQATGCRGQQRSIEPTLSGMGPWTLTWSDGYVQTIPLNGDRRRYVAPTETTVYSLASATCASCPAGTNAIVSGSTTIRVSDPPVATLTGGGTSCDTSNVPLTLTITGGTPPYSVVWSDGMSQEVNGSYTRNVWASPGETKTITITSIKSGMCAGTATGSATVTGWSRPVAQVSGGGAYCHGGPAVTITATLTGMAPFTIVWSDGVTQQVSGTTATRTVTPSTSTTYSITSITSGGCVGSSNGAASVTSASTPTAQVSGGGYYCGGYPGVQITAALTGTGPFTIVWSDGHMHQVSAGATTATRNAMPTTATTYTITSISSLGCNGVANGSAFVGVSTSPSGFVTGGGTFCEGSSVTVTATLTGTAPFTVTWSDGVVQTTSSTSLSRQVSPATATTYSIAALTDAYCSGSHNGQLATATPVSKPVITQQPQNKTIARNTSAALTVSTTETGLSYQWYQGPSGTTTTPVGTSSASFTTPKLRSTTQYWVRIWKSGCASYPTNSATATVTVQ